GNLHLRASHPVNSQLSLDQRKPGRDVFLLLLELCNRLLENSNLLLIRGSQSCSPGSEFLALKPIEQRGKAFRGFQPSSETQGIVRRGELRDEGAKLGRRQRGREFVWSEPGRLFVTAA